MKDEPKERRGVSTRSLAPGDARPRARIVEGSRKIHLVHPRLPLLLPHLLQFPLRLLRPPLTLLPPLPLLPHPLSQLQLFPSLPLLTLPRTLPTGFPQRTDLRLESLDRDLALESILLVLLGLVPQSSVGESQVSDLFGHSFLGFGRLGFETVLVEGEGELESDDFLVFVVEGLMRD